MNASHFHRLRIACALLAACACWAAPLRAQEAGAEQPAMKGATPVAGGKVTLDFAGAEIDAVARTMATLTGRNVVVDPRVKGTITLTSTTPVAPAEAMRLFGAQLRTQGLALVDSEGITLVLPEAEAKLIGGAVSAGPAPRSSGGQILTQIFRLTHENANNLVPILRPLISPNNTINVSPGANALVITDYAENLQRMGRIVAALDIAPATGVEVVRLKYAVASDLTPLAARLLDAGGGSGGAGAPAVMGAGQPVVAAASGGGSEGGYRTTLVAEPRSNAIIIRAANPARVALAKALIEQLDQPPQTRSDGEQSNIHVVYLKNAEAAKLAVTLRAALASLPGQTQNGGASVGGSAPAAAPMQSPTSYASNTSGGSGTSSLSTGPSINAAANNQPSTGGPIQADPATNSLIISAPEPVYRELRAVIDKLDQRRAQVYVESLIAEVNANREADFGIQWMGLMKNGNTYGAVGTNYSTPSANGNGTSTNLISFASQFYNIDPKDPRSWTPPTGNLVTPNTGFNLLIGSGTFGALANFIQSSGVGNVLATPTVLTLDNEEAKIVVGKNLPFVTGSYTTNTTGTGNAVGNPFQTYDRQDVGLTLRVKPQISEDGVIKLVIYQEVSSVASTDASGPTTNKRSIESSVLVDDGAIVAIGGLLQDQYQENEDKVPVLGDIPLMGNLFKSRNRGYVKTNLMVFLRPVIVRDAAATERYSLDRYDLMRAALHGNQPEPSAVLPVGPAPQLPAARPVTQDVWTRPAPPPPLIEQPPSGDGNLYEPHN